MNLFRKKHFMLKLIVVSITSVVALFASNVAGANYPLEITAPQEGLNTHSRWYKAYPGIQYKVPVGVFGGMYPFTYELTTYPSGMTIDENTGVITWDNPTTSGSPHSVTVRVTDAENSIDSHSWTITVNTSNFVFIDPNAGDGGNGTISSPLNELSDIWGSDGRSRTYNNYFVYMRGGTYEFDDGEFRGSPQDQQYAINWRPYDSHPHVWLEYPGETAIIDHNLGNGNGAYIRQTDSETDIFWHGIKFQDMRNHTVRGGGDRNTYFECEFYNGGPWQDGDNSSFIMYAGTGLREHDYVLVKDCSFDTASGAWSFVKSYSSWKAVYEGNTFQNPGAGLQDGLALKAYDQYVSVRANTFDGDYMAGSFGGNWNQAAEYDISFNKFINADTYHTAVGDPGAFLMNYHSTQTGPVYIYRNTIEGTVLLRRCSSAPINIYDNVIVNNNSGHDNPNGSLIVQDEGSCPSLSAVNNLVGSPSDNIIDDNGDFTDNYSSYIGTYGHALSGIQAPRNLRIVITQGQ